MSLAVVIPSYNAQDTIKSTLISVSDFPVFLVDNASEDNTIEIAQKCHNELIVSSHHHLVNRVENWSRAINIFLKSDYEWMKWLFTGDVLLTDAFSLLQQGIQAYPTAKMIVCNMYEVDKNKKSLWRPKGLNTTRLLNSQDAIRLAAKHGNWFGPPLVQCIHRDALEQLAHFGCLPWVADMEMSLDIAKRFPVLYLNEPIGEFYFNHRKYFHLYNNSPKAIFEESLMQLKAIETYKELSLNKEECSEFASSVQFQAVKRLILRKDLSIMKKLKNKFFSFIFWAGF